MPSSSAFAPPSQPRWSELFSGQNAIFAVALGGGVTLHAINIYITTTTMPSIVKDIGGLEYYAWNTTLFVIASILGSALSVHLLHRAGPRRAYVFAALLFALGTLGCTLTPSMAGMLAGRFVQGFGGGFLYALAYGVIRLVFPERLWARAISLISIMWGVATLVGPAVGGIFAQYGAWRLSFGSLIPVILLFAALAAKVLPRTAEGKQTEPLRLPVKQLALLPAIGFALSAGSVVESIAWKAASIIASILLLAALVALEKTSRARLLPRGTLTLGAPLAGLFASAALLMVGMQPEIYVSLLLQVLHGQKPMIAGYLTALMAIGWSIGTLASASWKGRRANRAILVGPYFSCNGLVLLALFLSRHGQGSWLYIAPSCLGLLLMGSGMGLGWPHLVTKIYQTAPPDQQDLAAGAITTVQLFATALGAALAGLVANLAGMTNPDAIAGGQKAALWLFGLFTLAPFLAIWTTRTAVRPANTSATPGPSQ